MLAGALALSGLLKSLLFGVQPHDPVTFAAVPALAAYLPARRVSRIASVEAFAGRTRLLPFARYR